MAINLLLTFVGVDRPGIVQELSALVSAHDGNWLESKMSRMGGRFAGIALVELPASLIEGFKVEISQVRELSVYLEESGVQKTDADTRPI